jgi:hypothetical protein
VHRTILALVATALPLFSLVAPRATAQEARTRDSAGVRIIENSARKDAPVLFRLGETPLMEVGGRESNRSDEFEHNQGYLRGVRLSQGGLAVIDVSRVHYFDPNGRRIRIVGQGPQRFQYMTSICRTRGDTLVVSDQGMISFLDGRGEVFLTVPRGDIGSAPFSFCLDDGTFVLEQYDGVVGPRQHRLTRLRSDGSIVNVVGTFPGPALDFVTMVGPAVAASGDRLYYGDPFTGEIRVYDPLGALRRIVRTADRGDSITSEEAEQRMDRTIPLNVTGDERKARMDRMRSRPYARNWPVFSRLDVGTDGTIWVQDFRKASQTPVAWTAIDSTGRIVGRLVFPAVPERTIGPDILSFGNDYVMLRRFDADRRSSIAIYPLVKLEGSSR